MISSQKNKKNVSFSLPNLMIRRIQSLRARQRLQEWPLLPHGDRFSTPFSPWKLQLGGYIPGNVFFHAFSMFFLRKELLILLLAVPKKGRSDHKVDEQQLENMCWRFPPPTWLSFENAREKGVIEALRINMNKYIYIYIIWITKAHS